MGIVRSFASLIQRPRPISPIGPIGPIRTTPLVGPRSKIRCRPWPFFAVANSFQRAIFAALRINRAVAQLGSALEWGSRGRGFESRRPEIAKRRTGAPAYRRELKSYAVAWRLFAASLDLPGIMIGKGPGSFLDRSTVIALSAFVALSALTVLSLTALAQIQGTPTPSPSQSPSPRVKIPLPPKPYATGYGSKPSPSPSPSVQLPPDLLPNPQSPPIPTPPPPATNDLLPENKPAPTPVGPQPTEPDLLPSTPTPGPSPSGSASAEAKETPTPKKLAEQVLKEKMRFRQIESAAERDPHAIELWSTANKQYTMEYRREWQRLYYVYVCDLMRKFDPSLSELINNWEATHLSAQSVHNSKPTVPSDELRGPAEEQSR